MKAPLRCLAVTVPPGDYLADTEPRRIGDTLRFRAEIPEAWKVFYAFGGITMGAALRAVEAALGRDDLQPLTATAIFCEPVPCGGIETEVEIIRNGRNAAQAVADLRIEGSSDSALRLQTVFGRRHDSDLTFTAAEFPDVRPPLECEPPPPERDPDDPFPPINFHEQSDWRPAMPERAWDAEVRAQNAGVPEAAAWLRLLKPPYDVSGNYDWSALCIPGDQVGMSVGRMLAADHPDEPWFTLTLEMSIRFIRRPSSDWILEHGHGWLAGDGYASGDTFLWDDERHLCAIATQTARLQPMDPKGGPRGSA